jgi:Protein of unknown function (DUF2771)
VRSLRAGTVLLLALPVAACGHGAADDAPPTVRVAIGDRTADLKPTQYCDGSSFHRYDVEPPVIAAEPGTRIRFTVPQAVARRGWGVQVYDQQLEKSIGNVAVPAGAATFDQITMSDAVPSAFYLVVVEKATSACHQLAGSWPAGFIRVDAGS